MAEDVPACWDNWDIDADIELKFKECARLLSREVVSDGAVAFIVRSKYQISEKSKIEPLKKHQSQHCLLSAFYCHLYQHISAEDNQQYIRRNHQQKQLLRI